jgi:thioredoxin 1
MATAYLPADSTPSREELDRSTGLVLLEFGTPWCGICKAIAPRIAAHLAAHPEVRHVKVEDGPGQPLGRSFGVRLWPNLIFLRDGVLVRQLARPMEKDLQEAFAALLAT